MNCARTNTKASILYVDDDQENLTSFRSVFRRIYDIHLASSAVEAIDILRNNDIQVLITDQRMPEMTGTQLLEIAAKEFPQTLRFLLTGFSDYNPLIDAINKGKLHGYFSKPFDADLINARIDENLRSYFLECQNVELFRQLKQQENFLNIIIENIPHMISVKDAETLSFVRFNRAGETLLGYSREEMLGKTDYDLFPADLAEQFVRADRTVLETGKLLEIPKEPVETRTSGTHILHTLKIPIHDEGGKPLFLLCVSRDITEYERMREREKRMESQLRQVQKIEALGTLAGGIAHDFNNILSVILGFTELSLLDMEKGSKHHENLQSVYQAGIRAKELVKQILTFARKSDEEVKPVRVGLVAREAVKLLRSTIPTSIDIRSSIATEALILADPTQIHQIFMNLCTNAAHAMEANGGVLTVSIAEESLADKCPESHSGLLPGDYVKVEVTDTGKGIPAGDLEFIFEPYFTTKAPGEGTGLGLSVVHGAVKRCGGHIFVESEVDRGTRFTIYLPSVKAASDNRILQPEEIPGGTERILFVDDEPIITRMVRLTLEDFGYKVTICPGSVEALALFKDHSDDFDLVITDMTMPGLTGDRLASEIIGIRPEIPVIVCTGYSRNLTEERAAAIGIRAIVMKPVSNKDLAKTVRRVLDESKAAKHA